MKNKGHAARKLAISILLKASQRGSFVNETLNSFLDQSDLSDRDRRFVSALVFGVIKQQSLLDKEIQSMSKQPLNKLPPAILNLLRIAFFQLLFMPDIPPFAVVFTSTELAKEESHRGRVSYVNGLLRQYLRNKNIMLDKNDQLPDEGDDSLTSKELSVSYSVPEWLIERWLANYGSTETIAMLQFFQKPPDLALRPNTRKITTAALSDLFKTNNIIVYPGKLFSDCLILKKTDSSAKNRTRAFKGSSKNLPGYKEGLFVIQDEASAFVAQVVAPKAGEFIIDLCAAPGSKTLYLAELMNDQGRILAVDKDIKRFEYLKEKRLELKLNNIEIKGSDARSLNVDEQADKVLLDAPCTGTGVLHRRQDLRHKKNAQDLETLVSLQRQLLDVAANLVRRGGILVYSTCSLEPEENIDNIKWFLAQHPQFKGDDIQAYIPKETLTQWLENLPESKQQEQFLSQLSQGMIQLLPFRHELSGFFIARMVKNQ